LAFAGESYDKVVATSHRDPLDVSKVVKVLEADRIDLFRVGNASETDQTLIALKSRNTGELQSAPYNPHPVAAHTLSTHQTHPKTTPNLHLSNITDRNRHAIPTSDPYGPKTLLLELGNHGGRHLQLFGRVKLRSVSRVGFGHLGGLTT
jgi:hypothetical protein